MEYKKEVRNFKELNVDKIINFKKN